MASSIGRGGLPPYSPASSTATVTNGLRTVTFTGTALQTVNPTTGATEYAAAFGDEFWFDGVDDRKISSVDSATQITLNKAWTGATTAAIPANLGVTGAGGWLIVRNSVPANGPNQKAIADVLAIGQDAVPNTSYAVDDNTARIKMRSNSGNPQIAAGASGAADGALHGAIQITEAGAVNGLPAGSVQFPLGMKEYQLGFRNRLINGNFDVWQYFTAGAWGAGGSATQFTADRWFTYSTGVGHTAQKIAAPLGFRGQSAMQLTATGLTATNQIDITQRIEAQMLADCDSVDCTLAFDLNAATTAGTLTAAVLVQWNSAPDNGTFATNTSNIPFTIPVGSSKIIVPLTAAQMAGAKNGGQVSLLFTQNTATGNPTIQIGAVQLERGKVANDFEFRPYAVVLLQCQRYYEKSYAGGTFAGAVSSAGVSTTLATSLPSGTYLSGTGQTFKATKRAAPTLTFYSPTTGASGKARDNLNSSDVTCSLATPASDSEFAWFAANSAAAIGYNFSVQWTAQAEL